MRDVRSRNYFEQMKGRGTRTMSLDDLKKVTPSARYTKDHFVIVDAVGVTKSTKTDSRPLDRKPSTPLKKLLESVSVGIKDDDLFTTLAGRLARLEIAIPPETNAKITEVLGTPLNVVVKDLLYAYDADKIEEQAKADNKLGSEEIPTEEQKATAQEILADKAQSYFTGEVIAVLENARKALEQIVDTHNPDNLLLADWSNKTQEDSLKLVNEFIEYVESHKAEMAALQFFYSEPYRRRELNLKMVKDLLAKLKQDKPTLMPVRVWRAYEQLDGINQASPKNELVALVSLVRRVIGLDEVITPLKKTVDKNFQDWVFAKQAGALKFNDEQMTWLRMIKEHITSSFSFSKDDLSLTPFIEKGGLDRMWELFGEQIENVINELNASLIA
jgi:type I restriction enzyme R subunit